MGGDDVRAAAVTSLELLARTGDADARVPLMDTDLGGVVAHLTSCLTWYAHDLVAGPAEVSGFSLTRRPGAGLPELRAQLGAAAEVLARVVERADPDERGAHSWGLADAAGFAAMGCAELLVHTGDVAEALDLDWAPPPQLADATLTRLFPWVDVTDADDPAAALRWATGRAELPGRERLTAWRWHAAPLEEWDGSRPA
jgi:hypothetical protein